MVQKYNSACTSINSKKIPSVFKKVNWIGGNNLDYGGGKFDIATQWLISKGVTNFIYDPFNRSKFWNEEILSCAPFDTATLSNVLNVIEEKEIRLEILAHCKSLLKPNGKLFISVYEGNKSGLTKVNHTKNSCQLNRPLRSYVDEIKEIFETVEIKKGIIIAG